jgi:hypothetical protein
MSPHYGTRSDPPTASLASCCVTETNSNND